MALPTPTFLGQVYTDTTSGRSWVCVSLTPPVWAVNKNVLLSIQGGLSVSGGASITGGLKIAGGLNVTGGATITGGVALYGTVTVNGSPISLSGAVGGSGIANVPLASASVTGVASFGNQFVVSNAGAVGLTSNYVISVNGRTGNVVLPLASSSITGVASFGNEFVVSTAGAVSLTSNNVISVNGRTGNVVLPVASSSATGVASFGNQFVVSAAGAVSLTSNYVISVNGITGSVTGIAITGSNTFLGLQTLNAGLTTNHLYVSNGATFANGLVVQAGGISITGGLNVSSGTISGTLATAAQTNITSVGTLTKLEVGSGGISSAGGITGTINTAAQPNITSVGTLTSLSSSGLVTASGGITSNHLYVSNGVTFAGTSVHTGLGTFNAGITSNHLYVTNGVTFASTSVHTGLGTFNAGITSSHLYVTSGVTFAGTSVHTGLGTFNAGLTTTHLHVTNGATFTGTVSAVTILAALSGNASTATTLATARTINQTSFNGSSNILINQVYREDNRIISPSEGSIGYSRFAFTCWNNNDIDPYADAIHFRTYIDTSGGKDNLLMLNKSVIGMRLWQQEFGSATAYTAYKDVAFIQDVVTSFNGLTGAVSGVTTSAANTFTALNTFNAGITSSHLYVTNGVTFAGTSVHTGLGTFNAGITSSHLYVTSGATFAGANGIFLAMNGSNPLGTTGLSLVSDSSASGALKITTPYGVLQAGPQNTSYSHFYTDRDKYYFNKPIQIQQVAGQSTIGAYASNIPFTIGTPGVTNGTLFTRITVLTGPNSSIGGYVGIGTTTPQAKLDIAGSVIVNGNLSVTGGTASFNAMSVGTLTGAYFMAEQGWTAAFIYAPNPAYNSNFTRSTVTDRLMKQGLVYRDNGQTLQPYRWGADNLLSSNYSYGYSEFYSTAVIIPPTPILSTNNIIKIIDISSKQGGAEFSELALLGNGSLTAFGSKFAGSAFQSLTGAMSSSTKFIDIATGASGTVSPISTDYDNYENAGWWLGLMDNGRLTGSAWSKSNPLLSNPSYDPTNVILTQMPTSLRWDATSGITAKAILGSDDAYCYAILSDGSLTAWGATCFMLGGSGGAGTWTTGGTGGILSNFPTSAETFTKFASRSAYRTLGFAIKSDGNLRCFGYTGNTPTVAGGVNGVVDYRSIFTTTRTGDDQIIKIDCLFNKGANACYGTQFVFEVIPSGTNFFRRQYSTTYGSDFRVFVGLTKGGSLTAGFHVVNQTTLPSNLATPLSHVVKSSAWSSAGVTFSDMVCMTDTIVVKKPNNTLTSLGPTNSSSSSWAAQNQIPYAFVQGSQTTVRFGGPVNISNVPLGQSDPYTQVPILDVRGGIVAGQIAIASDSSTKSSIAMEQTNDGVVSFWKKDLLENLAPQEFNYLGDTSPTTIGYFAENAEAANPNYVTRINPVNVNADGPPNSTGDINTPYSAINLNTLLVGTIESLRELNTEMPRIWTMEAVPYPSKVKNGDLWYFSSENRLYIRKNETWIQIN